LNSTAYAMVSGKEPAHDKTIGKMIELRDELDGRGELWRN